jgi:hypothetical protein
MRPCSRELSENKSSSEKQILRLVPTQKHKYKESAHMSLIDHPISESSLDISPIWTPIITAEVKELQLRPL